MMDKRKHLIYWLSALLLTACHFFEDPGMLEELFSTDSERDRESGSDSRTSDPADNDTDIEAAAIAACETFCRRFTACAVELNGTVTLSEDECTSSCVATDWGGDACGQCYFACDISLDCMDYYLCLEDCPCDDVGAR